MKALAPSEPIPTSWSMLIPIPEIYSLMEWVRASAVPRSTSRMPRNSHFIVLSVLLKNLTIMAKDLTTVKSVVSSIISEYAPDRLTSFTRSVRSAGAMTFFIIWEHLVRCKRRVSRTAFACRFEKIAQVIHGVNACMCGNIHSQAEVRSFDLIVDHLYACSNKMRTIEEELVDDPSPVKCSPRKCKWKCSKLQPSKTGSNDSPEHFPEPRAGFINDGSSPELGAILQVLFHAEPFLKWLSSHTFAPGSFAEELADLCKQHRYSTVVNPVPLLNKMVTACNTLGLYLPSTLLKPTLAEIFLGLLNAIKAEDKHQEEMIESLFGITVLETESCIQCNVGFAEKAFDLAFRIPVYETDSIQSSLDEFEKTDFSSEFCCGEPRLTKCDLLRYPEILFIFFERECLQSNVPMQLPMTVKFGTESYSLFGAILSENNVSYEVLTKYIFMGDVWMVYNDTWERPPTGYV
ncbi:Formate--tetrahydrofolate ligase [Frankliniella fusca]|uniref:Formate--tetrahydrofolate ligase n=1 Tax=Frankliniella fusca TaxID=407009 RepID=A0AAE1GVD4_9NEOP|nr:Formate--tetrahydrofolate ligase [Frankliniella fusca]